MKRLLFIAHRVPYPPDKGERVRAFHEIRVLSSHFRITLAVVARDDAGGASAAELRQYCEKVITGHAGGRLGLVRGGLSLCTGGSITEGYFRSRRLRGRLVDEGRKDPFDLVFAYSSSTLPYALAVPAKARVMDLVDADSAKWDGYAENAWWPKRWLFRREAGGVRALERQAVEQCDAVLLVSEAEVRTLGIRSNRLFAVGNGVDPEYFRPAQAERQGRPGLVFTGTMDYAPNVEGVCWFVREVWPALKGAWPDLTFTIVGRNPASPVRRLGEVPGVRVTGSVPDVRPYLAAAAVAVAPLRIGRGIQNKVLEAMAMGRAVVASPAALGGLEIAVGAEALQADASQAWQRTILDLLADPARRDELGRAARQRVVADYGWDARMKGLIALCQRMTSDTAAVGAAQAAAGSGATGARGRGAAPATRRP